MDWFTKYNGDQALEVLANNRFNEDATIVVLRAWGDGVDPIYILEKSNKGYGLGFNLSPLDKRFDSYEVDSFTEACEKFVAEYCPYESSDWEIALCMGTRGLTQYLLTTDCNSYWLDVILPRIHGDDAVATLFKCAEKLGLKMTIDSRIETGEVTASRNGNKININNRSCYLMYLASSIQRDGAIIKMESESLPWKKEPEVKKKRFFFF